MLKRLKSFFNKKEEKADEGLVFSSAPLIKIEGVEYPCKIDSINTIKELEAFEATIETLTKETSESPSKTSELIEVIKDCVVLILGELGYNAIFNTDEKRDSYVWHIQVFGEIIRITYTYKSDMFISHVNSPVIEELKTIQANLNYKQKRALKKMKIS